MTDDPPNPPDAARPADAAGPADATASPDAQGTEDGAPITVDTADAQATRQVAGRLAGRLRPGDMIVLDGPLGAGKTTFTQGLGEALGVRGPVASPTFVIARVHPNPGEGPELVHVDAYRLGGTFDIDDLDLDSDLEAAVTVVEWGRDLVEHLTDSHLLIELRHPGRMDPAGGPEEPRRLRIHAVGPRWTEAERAALAAVLREAHDEGEH